MAARNTYVRPMTGWYRRNPKFRAYIVREGSSVFLGLYALILLWGVTALAGGPESYQGWLDFLASPLSVLLHLVVLAAACYHTYTWFQVAPKATPPLGLGSMRVPDQAIIMGGYAGFAVVSLIILIIAW
jgi:fumarate reductase subunit C